MAKYSDGVVILYDDGVVDCGHWHYLRHCYRNQVLKAYNLEITKGVSDDEFAPDTLITREQMATMMTRALTKAGINTALLF